MSSAPAVAAEETAQAERQRLDYRGKISPIPQFYLFSPADERLEAMVNAETLTFPKTDELACAVYWTRLDHCEGDRHARRCPWRDAPARPLEGVLPVREQPGYPDPKTGTMQRAMTAQQIVKELIGEDGTLGKLGKRGIRILFGDERDDLARQDSRVAWREAKYHICLALKNSHMAINQKQREADLPGLAPSKRVMEAMSYVAQYEAEFNPKARYACPECNWPFVEKNQRDAHIVAQHRDRCGLYGLTPFEALHPEEDDEANERVASLAAKKAELEKIDAEYAGVAGSPQMMGAQVEDLLQAMQQQIANLTAEVAQYKGGRRKAGPGRARARKAKAQIAKEA